MPEHCRACAHPDIDEINSHIIAKTMSMRKIAKVYSTKDHPLSYSGIRYHKKHHLKDIIEQVTTQRKQLAVKGVMKTIDAYDLIIGKLPEVIETASLNSIIRVLEARSRLMGEERQPPRIIIEWGLGLDREQLKQIEARYKVIEPEQLPPLEMEADLSPVEHKDEPNT